MTPPAGSTAAPNVAIGGQAPNVPKVVLIGDSIRLGYAPLVTERLHGRALLVSDAENGGDSANVLRNLDDWVIREQPDLVHVNCGLHDLKRNRDGSYQVGLDHYVAHLGEIVARIRANSDATVVFATTTPILDDRHAGRGAGFDRLEADVRRYNAAAIEVMAGARVPVHDLHWIVEQNEPEQLLDTDGTHYTPAGYERLAEAVVDCTRRHLAIRRYRALPAPASGAQVAAEYRAAEAERDAHVPTAYRRQRIPDLAAPRDATEWGARRPGVLEAVRQSLGDLPPSPSPRQARIIARELHAGYTLEKVAIDNGVDGRVTALLLIPERLQQPAPAVLWLHSSTPDSTQIIVPNTNGGSESLGAAFLRAGYVVLSPDAYWHGDRAGTGPAGDLETSRAEQESLFKLHLWYGRTLWGMFVRDDQIALDYLCSRPEVDATRIGATGMSMGSTRAWWLAALDERIAATVAVACLTRYQNLIAHGQLRQHGIYYFVNGLLQRNFDTEGVLSLLAPRPFLALTGELDAGSPADGIRILEQKVGDIYRALGAGDRFRSVLYPETGHTYTAAMRSEMLSWFGRWFGQPLHHRFPRQAPR